MKTMTRVMTLLAITVLSAAGFAQTTNPTGSEKLAALNAKFALPGGDLKFIAGQGGLPCAEIKSAACTGRIYLQGAHVAAWQPAGEAPVIFMSSKSEFIEGKPIRGGVPICFPWFAAKAGDASAPGHGVVRTMQWDVESTKLLPNAEVSIVLKTRSNDATKKYFPNDFEIENHVTFGRRLKMELLVKNSGSAPMTFTEAQHSYLQVQSIEQVSIAGLDGVDYVDKVDSNQKKKQSGDISFNGNTDRVYLNIKSPATVTDRAAGRTIVVGKENSATTVVWNPGEARARTIVDLGPEDWPHMLCVETANLMESEITLPPGQTHRMATVITLSK